MTEPTQEQFQDALYFSSILESENKKNFLKLLTFLSNFGNIYNKEKAKLPYHINLIDELHADENAHSRIFAKLLRYKSGNKYPILEEFITKVCEFNLNIEKPNIAKVDSHGRIDIPIFDKKYTLIIENKVTDKANDQNTENGGQLARYIETVRNRYNKKTEETFVVYTPKYTREPSEESWINQDHYSYKEEFKPRFRSLSYRDNIYPWLRDEILPNIKAEDTYLKSAIQQYIDHLEGIFSLRTRDKVINMKLQDFVKQQLGLQDELPEKAIDILSEKEVELSKAINQIQLLKEEYKKQIVTINFTDWRERLKTDFPDLEIVGDNFKIDKNYINIGIKFSVSNQQYVAIIEWKCNTDKIYYGIGRHFVSDKIYDNIPKILQELLDKYNLKKPDDYWYGWEYTTHYDSYIKLKNLINYIVEISD